MNHLYQVGGPCLSHTYDCSTYLLESEGGDLYLFDCGTPEGFEQIKNNIVSLGFDIKKIKSIFGTHGHYDHVGAAYLWKKECGCSLYLNDNDRERVEKGDSILTTAEILYGSTFTPVKVDMPLSDGDTFDFGFGITMKVIFTPGHTPGGVCFALDMNGYSFLIAGDTLHGGFCLKTGSDENVWKESIAKLMTYHFDGYTFGHMVPNVITDADRRIEELSRQFAVYYNPWFKPMKEKFIY